MWPQHPSQHEDKESTGLQDTSLMRHQQSMLRSRAKLATQLYLSTDQPDPQLPELSVTPSNQSRTEFSPVQFMQHDPDALVCKRLVISLCDHFQSALVALQSMQAQSSSNGQHTAGWDSCPDYLTVLLPSGPAQAQTARQSDPHTQAAHPSAAATAAVAPSAVRDLVRCLAVLRAMYTTLRATAAAATASASNTQGNSNQSCLSVLAYEFVTRFLLGTLRPSLDSSSCEGQNIAVYTLLRLLLTTLAVHGRDESGFPNCSNNTVGDNIAGQSLSLLELTLRMLVLGPQAMNKAIHGIAGPPVRSDHSPSPVPSPTKGSQENLVLVLWDRIDSQSRALSLSASLLLCSLLQTSPPLLGLLHVHSLPYSLGAAATAAALSNHAAGDDSMQGAGSWSASRMDADPAGLFSQQLTNALQMFDHNTSSSNSNGSHSWSKLLPSSADNGNTMRRAYAKTASRMLSRALFHSGDRLLSWPAAFFDRCLIGLTFHDQLMPSAAAAAVTLREGSFLDRLSKRLQVFAHLRVYEQLLVSELLQQSMCQLALVMVLGSESTAQRCLLVAQLLLHKVKNMLKEVAVAAQKQVSDVARKWTMLQDYLSSEAVEYLHRSPYKSEVPLQSEPPPSKLEASSNPQFVYSTPVKAIRSASAPSLSFFSPFTPRIASPLLTPVSKMFAKYAAINHKTMIFAHTPSSKQQLSNESHEDKALLTTLTVLQEMLWECQGWLLAVRTWKMLISAQGFDANLPIAADNTEEDVSEDTKDLIALQTSLSPDHHSADDDHRPMLIADLESQERAFWKEYIKLEAALGDTLNSNADDGGDPHPVIPVTCTACGKLCNSSTNGLCELCKKAEASRKEKELQEVMDEFARMEAALDSLLSNPS